jgi:hypothetical protein
MKRIAGRPFMHHLPRRDRNELPAVVHGIAVLATFMLVISLPAILTTALGGAGECLIWPGIAATLLSPLQATSFDRLSAN